MRDILLALIVLACLPMALMRPMVGLWLWIGFNYMNPHRLTWGFAYDLPWVQLVAIVTLFGTLINPRQRQSIPWKPVSVLLLVFLAWTGLTTIFAVEEHLASDQWITLLKIFVFIFVTLVLVTDKQKLHWVLWGIVLSFGFWGAKGGLFTLLTGGGYHVMGPTGSFFRDNNQFALVMCMTLPLMRYLQLSTNKKWIRRGLWLLMILTVVSILGTYSRGGFLGLGAMASMLILKSRNRVPLAIFGIALVAGALAFMPQKYTARMATIDNYQADGSAMGRIRSWEFATNVALANPLLGGGFDVWASDAAWNRYGPPRATHRAIHSIFFQVLGEHGFVGLALFLASIAAAWRSSGRVKKLARAGPDNGWMINLANMLQVSLAAYLAAGAFLAMAYFEELYQILVLVVLLQVLAERAKIAAANRTAATSNAVGRAGRSLSGAIPRVGQWHNHN